MPDVPVDSRRPKAQALAMNTAPARALVALGFVAAMAGVGVTGVLGSWFCVLGSWFWFLVPGSGF